MLFLIFLRIVHVFGSVLWVGSAIFYLFFMVPSAKAIGPAGNGVIGALINQRRYPLFMNLVSVLTILSGAALIYQVSGGLSLGWLRSGPGIGFTFGAVVGIAVWFVGFLGIRPRAERMSAIGKAIAQNGGQPIPRQVQEMQKIEREMDGYEKVDFVMLSISLLAMATARYWIF